MVAKRGVTRALPKLLAVSSPTSLNRHSIAHSFVPFCCRPERTSFFQTSQDRRCPGWPQHLNYLSLAARSLYKIPAVIPFESSRVNVPIEDLDATVNESAHPSALHQCCLSLLWSPPAAPSTVSCWGFRLQLTLKIAEIRNPKELFRKEGFQQHLTSKCFRGIRSKFHRCPLELFPSGYCVERGRAMRPDSRRESLWTTPQECTHPFLRFSAIAY